MERQYGKTQTQTARSAESKMGICLFAAWLVLFCVFYAYPLVYGIAVSFTDFTLNQMKPVGFANYVAIFQDYAFWRSLRAMLCYAALIISPSGVSAPVDGQCPPPPTAPNSTL